MANIQLQLFEMLPNDAACENANRRSPLKPFERGKAVLIDL